jgi:ABC-2 type transport system ATP-binding protein
MTTDNEVLRIEGLVKVFETGHRAVDGLSLHVRRQSIFGFIGLNGAGKTTTIRILAGLLKKDAGTIQIFGRRFRPDDPSVKADMGFVLDQPLYFEWMGGGPYLRFVGEMYGLPPETADERTSELLSFFEMADKRDDPIGTYSTGMKKKISLAAAMIHKPKFIVLDEPLEGIDALAASSIKETLTMTAAHGATIFITSHVLDTIERFCTDVAIIHAGKVILQCPTKDIRKRARKTIGRYGSESLEDLFVELVSDRTKHRHLSFL